MLEDSTILQVLYITNNKWAKDFSQKDKQRIKSQSLTEI